MQYPDEWGIFQNLYAKCINSKAWTTARMLRITEVYNHKDEQLGAWGIRSDHNHSGSKKLEFVKKKIESSDLPAPEFSCLINYLRPVLVTKLQGYNRQVKKNYISDSLSE